MRIVGGQFRGRKLRPPEGRNVRPTSDRTREAVFNILAHGAASVDFDGIHALDLFCGTGALGLEALSRGAAHCAFIDRDDRSLRLARSNSQGIADLKQAAFLKLDGGHLPPPPRSLPGPADIAFLDPPYDQGLVPQALLGLAAKNWLKPGATVVAELSSKEELIIPAGFIPLDERNYGAAKVHFLKRG